MIFFMIIIITLLNEKVSPAHHRRNFFRVIMRVKETIYKRSQTAVAQVL